MAPASFRPSTLAAGRSCSYLNRCSRRRSLPSYPLKETTKSKRRCARWHSPHRDENSTAAGAMISPQTEQAMTSAGSSERRHSSHTGRRASRSRGLLQMRQSEGKTRAAKLSSRVRKERRDASIHLLLGGAIAATATAGFRSPVLLKTTLQDSF